ncbi:MAG TPA: hypothetical protein VGH90_11560 [Chthoniobacteraceae bacterium]|jgi:hypothetical protein
MKSARLEMSKDPAGRRPGNVSLLVALAAGAALGWALQSRPFGKDAKAGDSEFFGDASREATATPAKENSAASHLEDVPRVIHASQFEAAANSLPRIVGRRSASQLRDLARAVLVEEIPAALQSLHEKAKTEPNDPAGDGYGLAAALARHWGEIDPRAAASYLAAGKPDEWSGFMLGSVLEPWASSQPKAVNAWLSAQPENAISYRALQWVIPYLVKSDPRAALAAVDRQTAGQSSIREIIDQWAESDPEAALAAGRERKLDSSEFNAGIAAIWSKKDPPAALAWATNLSARREETVRGICQAWASREPQEALAWVAKRQDPALRSEVIKAAFANLAAKDSAAAIEQANALPEGEGRDSALAAVIRSAATADPKAAAKMLADLHAGAQRDNAAVKICQAWAATDPRSALDWLIGNARPMGPGNRDFDSIVKNWAEKAPRDAAAWAGALPPGANRNAALNAAAAALASTDLHLAQSMFDQLPSEAQGKAAGALAEQYLIGDVDQARAWAESLPAGAGQAAAFAKIAASTAEFDPKGTADWLNTLPSGPARDQAILPFSEAVRKEDPETAITWVLSISDPLTRQDELARVASWWRGTDAKALRAWLDADTQLTPEEKRHLLAQ